MIYTFTPSSTAALLYVHSEEDPNKIACIYLSIQNGILVSPRDKKLENFDWPMEVKEEIEKYFGIVFSLPHNVEIHPNQSPRAKYVDSAVPWQRNVSAISVSN